MWLERLIITLKYTYCASIHYCYFYISFSYPLVGVVIDMSNRTEPLSADITVKCGFDFEILGISDWSSSRLDRIYEIPNEVEIIVKMSQ